MSASQTATSSHASSSHSNHTPPLSRLARIGAGLGLGLNKSSVSSATARPIYNDEEDSDWYIPYNGPYEDPPKDFVVGVNAQDAAGKGKGKRREVRDSWADFLTNMQQADPFARDSNEPQTQVNGGPSGSSSARTRSQRSGSVSFPQQEDEHRGRKRSREFAGSPKYLESSVTSPVTPLVTRSRGHTFGHGSSHVHTRAPMPTFVSLGAGDVGIGESPVPVQRVSGQIYGHSHVPLHGHERHDYNNHHAHFAPDVTETQSRQPQSAHAMLQNPRGSHSSFWTFGAGGSRKSAPSIYSDSFSSKDKDKERPSAETIFIGSGGRPSTSTYQSQGTRTVANGNAQAQNGHAVQTGTRDRSATFGERSFVGDGGSPIVRPRANTAIPSSVVLPGVFSPPPAAFPPTTQLSQSTKGKQRLDVDQDYATVTGGGGPSSDQSHSSFSYHNHPYAVSYPSTAHREHSRIVQPPPPPSKKPMIRLAVPFLSPSKSNLPHHLRNSSSRLLKASVSTPNLRTAVNASGTQAASAGVTAGRGMGLGQRNGTGSGYSSPSASAKWLSAETWCDALIFPRPRFKMRGAAHQISPPSSPIRVPPSAGSEPSQNGSLTPPNTAALRKGSAGKSQVQVQGERMWPLMAPPSTAPPLLLSSSHSHLPIAKSEFGTSDKQNENESQPKKKNGESGSGLKPLRPKSFAMDDLALPSPVPSLARVLRENDAFEKERDEWKKTAAKSFQNKRARSLSRSRLKAMTHGRKNSAEEEELVTSFGIIAASAFHGHQLSKPTISVGNSSTASRSMGTNSAGINTISTHSRKSSNESHTAKGHIRKESWSKAAIKSAKSTANAAGLCAFNVDVSPVDEKALNLERAIDHDDGRTKFVSLDLQRTEEKRDAGESGVVLIASHANTSTQASHQLVVPQPRPAVIFSPSPVPSDNSDASQSTSHSGVGIALSTPTVLVADQEQFLFPDHPFASTTGANREAVPRASEYAGPHPTSARLAEYNVDDSTLNNVSARHRLPPAANRLYASVERHPYAAAQSSSSSRPRPTLQVPTTRDEVSPSRRMFAEINSSLREVLPDEIQYSPYSVNPPSRNSKRDSDALGVEEALSVAFTHRSLDDMDMDEMEEDETEARSMDEEDLTGTSAVGAQILTAQAALRSAPLYRTMPQIEEDSVRDSWRDSRDDGDDTIMPHAYQHTPAVSGFSIKESTPSINSSPMTSPRLVKKYDETEDFSDLFYRPGHSAGNSIRAPSMEYSRGLASREPSGSLEKAPSNPISRTASVSALTGLTRQLSEEYNSLLDDEGHTFGRRDSPVHHDHEQGYREDEPQVHALHTRGSSGANVPLRVPMTRPQSIDPSLLVPEDVRSSRASSILDPQGTEEGTDVTYRLGEVPALSTPDPTSVTGVYRSSAHGSYFGDIIRDDSRPASTQDASFLHPQRPSLAPPPPTSATDTSRTSYLTSTSGNSRISQLSDFPAPPSQGAMAPGSIVQSYFSKEPEDLQDGDYSQHEIGVRRSRRTTFGGEEEVSSFDFSDA